MVSHSHLFCIQCGAGNLPHAKFCVVCGHSLQLDLSNPLPAVRVVPKVPPVLSALPNPAPPQHVQKSVLKQRYRIMYQIGEGGFAEVYKAADTRFGGRLVAIKSMSTEGLSSQEVSEATEAFKREAFMLAGLLHPNLPSIYDYFSEDHRWYLIMSFIDGMTLEDYLKARGGRLPVEKVLPIGIQLCSVLSYLHKRHPPIIFRDLKLANVMRTPERQLYLIDFGVARLFKHGQTRDTMALGSPGYAAPEQYGKAQTTPQADIYSLGATLHHLLSGTDPSDAPFRFAPLHIPAYPDLNMLIMSMIENDPRKRPFSMSLVKQELQRIAFGYSSEWARRQNNSLHYANQPDPVFPPPSVPRGQWTPQVPDVNQQKPPQNIMGHIQRAMPPAPFAPRRPAPQQVFSRPAPPVRLSFASQLSRRAMIIGSGAGLLVAGSLFTYFLAQHVGTPDIQISSVQAAGNQVLPAVATAQPLNSASLLAVAWSPDGRRIIAGGNSGRVQVLDSVGHLINNYDGHNAPISAVAWSPDGGRVASGSYDTTVQIWNPDTDQMLATYGGDIGSVGAIAWSPDDNYIASADYAHNVLVWNAGSRQTIQIYTNHTDQVRTLAWSPNSTYIASGSADCSVQVWRAMHGNMLLNYQGHRLAVESVAWSPDGTRIASASDDRTVHVWDALPGPRGLVNSTLIYAGHNAAVTAVAWSPDGHYIASGSQDRTVRVWSVLDTGLCYVYQGHSNAVLSVAWSSSGRIASTDADGNLRIWVPSMKS